MNDEKVESDAIKRARQDVNDRTVELERAKQVLAVAEWHLRTAWDALNKLLENQNAKS